MATLLTALEAELDQTEKFHEPPPLSDQSGRFLDVVMLQLSKVNWRVALPSLGAALALLVLILGYRAWRVHQSKDPLSSLGPGLRQRRGQRGRGDRQHVRVHRRGPGGEY